MRHDLEGVYNGAADGVLVLSEVAGLLGKPLAPVLPPLGTSLAAGALRRAGLRISPETLGLLRYGRGLDNRKLKATGYRYRYTSREAVISCASTSAWPPSSATPRTPTATSATSRSSCAAARACAPTARRPEPAPTNLAPGERRGASPAQGPGGYDDLDAEELIALLPSLEPEALAELAAHEGAHAARPEVMKAIAGLQGWEART